MQTAHDLLKRDKELQIKYAEAQSRVDGYRYIITDLRKLINRGDREVIELMIDKTRERIKLLYGKMDSFREEMNEIADALNEIRVKGYIMTSDEPKQFWTVRISRAEIWAVLLATVPDDERAEALRWFQDRIAQLIHEDFNRGDK